MPHRSAIPAVDILWITAGLGCDGDSIAITAATQPSLEDIVRGAIPGIAARSRCTIRSSSFEVGDEFLKPFHQAAAGKLGPFVLVVEGSIPNENNKAEGYWAGFGNDHAHRPADHHLPLDRSAGSARLGRRGVRHVRHLRRHSCHGRAIPPAALGLADYLGWDWKSQAGIPLVCVPGCPVQPDNFMEVVLYLLNQAAGRAPMIPLDEQLRPTWLFGNTVHEGCDRGGYYEQADFAGPMEAGSPKCIVKLGCWGPVVQCNVGKRGWINGIGGCPNVGGVCIGCTMPGFPDKFMPFLEEPPGAQLSTTAVVMYGKTVRALRNFTRASLNREPDWRNPNGKQRADKDPLAVPILEPATPGSMRRRPHHFEGTYHRHDDKDRDAQTPTGRNVLGSRSPGSSAAWESTPRSISPTAAWPSAIARRRSSAATACS